MTNTINGQLWQDQPHQALDAYTRDGYVALSGFLTPDQVAETRASVARFISDTVPHLPREQVFYETLGQPDTLKQIIGLFNHDTFFHRLMFNSRFEKLAELLLQGPVVGKNMQYFNKPPKIGKATPPHQDGYYFMLHPCEALTMWLALEEVDEENGCVRYVRGSHLLPPAPPRPHPDARLLPGRHRLRHPPGPRRRSRLPRPTRRPPHPQRPDHPPRRRQQKSNPHAPGSRLHLLLRTRQKKTKKPTPPTRKCSPQI